jgi:hypothetical protein
MTKVHELKAAANASLISVNFTYLEDIAEAAHSNSKTIVVNYDLKAGKVLELADLFKSDADYLKFLSDYCIRSLTKREVSDAEWLLRGAGPEAEITRTGNCFLRGCSLRSAHIKSPLMRRALWKFSSRMRSSKRSFTPQIRSDRF